ncbi:hypothetical protein J2853_003661 [Streptosporangium lutulentum]|uniref:Uncharacterized protein n=1 Tax=Streptosporangium lutulentum TaxID=1461250 RepID=A0ABT9QCF0_9ACTN|nr:hypothetical protein [Streptosporangium lutulentum]MDP9844450.1 hypothetical protein [Streptosporangium lutulentum]
MAVTLRQVPLQIGGEDVGVFGLSEPGEGEAVALTGVGELALQKQIGQGFPEPGAPVEADEPRGGEPFPPACELSRLEHAFELGVGGLPGIVAQHAEEVGSFPVGHVEEVAVEKIEVTGGP